MKRKRQVVIADYDPGWPAVFQDLAQIYLSKLGELALSVEHVGSTSVPGLPAKPIIDIDIVIESHDKLPVVVDKLEQLGYQHEGDLGITGREAFKAAGTDVPRDGSGREWPRHHLYVCTKDSPELRRHLAFRDYLRSNPQAVKAYGDLKRRLAQLYTWDVEAYWKAKSEFVEGILALVLQDHGR